MLKKIFAILLLVAVLSSTAICADVIPGDVNGDGKVNDKDAIWLLYYCFMPDHYPINQDGDFNFDGKVNDLDSIYMLYHCFVPEHFPIENRDGFNSAGTTVYTGNIGSYVSLKASCSETEGVIDFTVSVNESVYATSFYIEITFPECFELENSEWLLMNGTIKNVSENRAVIAFSNAGENMGDVFGFSLKALSVTDTEQEVSVRVAAKNFDSVQEEVFDETVIESIEVKDVPDPQPDNSGYYISLHSSSTPAEVGDVIDFTVSVNESVYATASRIEITFPECFELENSEWLLTEAAIQDVSGNQAVIAFSDEKDIGGDIFEFSLKALSVTDTEQEVSVRTIAKNSYNDPDTVFDETVNVEISVIERPPVIIEQDPVVLSEISILDSSYNMLDRIPSTSFVAQVSAQNISHEGFFTVMFAYYDIDGKLLGVRYMYADPDVGKTTSFGASITNADGNVVKVTAMVFDTLNSMKPLTEKKEIVLPFNPNSEELMATLDKAVLQYAEMRDTSTRARVQYICDVMIGLFEQVINDANDGNLIDEIYVNNYYGDFVSAVKMFVLEGEVLPPLVGTIGFSVADANEYKKLIETYVTEDVQQLVIDWFDIDLSVFE